MTSRIAQLLLVALLAGVASADDKPGDRKPAEIETIMNEGHAGKKSLLNQIKAHVKEEDWGEATKAAYKLRQFGEDLGKNTPPKGGDASWTLLSKGYKEITADIAKGVDAKDKTAATKATAALSKSCSACHKQHKP